MGRLVLIGDVHGCSAELGDLLAVIGPTPADDVIFVGDLVARGPDSRGVVALFRQIGARGVLGNHEARVLSVRAARRAGQPARRLGPSHEALLAELGEEDFAALDALPLHLDVPESGLRVVHAGVVPGLPLESHDAWALTNIRSVEAGKASDHPGAESWAASYHGPPHVVFGHDARRALQLHAWATGLDTACVYGGSLTALVMRKGDALPFPRDRRELLVSVRARRSYCAVSLT